MPRQVGEREKPSRMAPHDAAHGIVVRLAYVFPELRLDVIEKLFRRNKDLFINVELVQSFDPGPGIDAVIDWGIWTREERDIYREAARAAGIRVVLCVLDPPIEEIRRRLQVRNADRPAGVFFIEQADMERGERYWQTPTEEELALYDGERE